GNTPVMLRLVRRDPHCTMIIGKEGWLEQRIDFHHTILPAMLLDAATGALAAGLVQVAHVNFAGSSGTGGGTISVSASGYGYATPAAVGFVVFSAAMLVDAGSGALWSHSPARVHVDLKPAPH